MPKDSDSRAPDDGEDLDERERARRAILARRRRFVIASAAAAGLGMTACESPKPCLNIAEPEPPSTASA